MGSESLLLDRVSPGMAVGRMKAAPVLPAVPWSERGGSRASGMRWPISPTTMLALPEQAASRVRDTTVASYMLRQQVQGVPTLQWTTVPAKPN
jgi:hypothetical protein